MLGKRPHIVLIPIIRQWNWLFRSIFTKHTVKFTASFFLPLVAFMAIVSVESFVI